jgi:hypothetical protein
MKLEDGCLLGCSAVLSGRSVLTFQRYLLPPSYPGDGGSMYLWNVGKLLPDYNGATTQKTASSYSPSWEPQILLHGASWYAENSSSGLRLSVSHWILMLLTVRPYLESHQSNQHTHTLFANRLNVIVPSMPRFSKWSLSLQVFRMCYMSCPIHPP